MSFKHQVTIYDTTLRDGTQGEGISLSSLDKIRIAEKLDAFGVDYIEGGWPGSNPKDVEFFEKAKNHPWRHAKIVAFGSTRRKGTPVEDDPQIQTLLDAETPVITFFGKSWQLHVTEVLKTTVAENQAMIRDTAAYLASKGKEVIYDAEHFFDGYKADSEHALDTLRAAKEGGASMLVLCDTNGGTMPEEIEAVTAEVLSDLGIPVGIHTHDDAGLGVANALAAVRVGASQVQGTINGYGERTGNCNLTSVIPNLELKLGISCVNDLSQLSNLAFFVDEAANMAPNPRAPYIGRTCFAHKGGMHVNAVQKIAHSYEHIEPERVGNQQQILVSELSGQSNVLMLAEKRGIALKKGSPEARAVLAKVKAMEKEGYEFEAAGGSFELLLRKELGQIQPAFVLEEYHSTTRRNPEKGYETCEATVKVNVDGEQLYEVANGDGPVNALDAALRKALSEVYPHISKVVLQDYKVRIIDSKSATAARTRVLITSSDHEETWGTVGVSENIISASYEALADSLQYFLAKEARLLA